MFDMGVSSGLLVGLLLPPWGSLGSIEDKRVGKQQQLEK